jgi:hypothetical protein
MKLLLAAALTLGLLTAATPAQAATTGTCTAPHYANLWQCQTKPHRLDAATARFPATFDPSAYGVTPDFGLGYYPQGWRRNAVGGGRTHARHGR